VYSFFTYTSGTSTKRLKKEIEDRDALLLAANKKIQQLLEKGEKIAPSFQVHIKKA
jgi:hypothetical protein